MPPASCPQTAPTGRCAHASCLSPPPPRKSFAVPWPQLLKNLRPKKYAFTSLFCNDVSLFRSSILFCDDRSVFLFVQLFLLHRTFFFQFIATFFVVFSFIRGAEGVIIQLLWRECNDVQIRYLTLIEARWNRVCEEQNIDRDAYFQA